MKYRREIDGLRALAVVPVILFHGGFDTFGGGFVGVDVFFVISGYLITSIIISELREGRFSLGGFYERRARRILPAMFLVMLVCLPLAWWAMYSNDLKGFAKSLIAVSLFSSNMLFWRESGYFDTVAELKPLLHTWSLAVEEQYYLLFPVFLLLTWRLGQKWIMAMLFAIALASLAVAEHLSQTIPSAAFFLLPARGWELLLGAFVAFYLIEKRDGQIADGRLGDVAALLGLFMIAVSVLVYDKTTPFPGVYALVPTMGTALLILFAAPHTLVGRLLGSRLLVGIGLISYSAYLWHQPLFAIARLAYPGEVKASMLIALALAAFLLAYLSWRYVEVPLRRGRLLSRNQIFLSSVLVSTFFVAVGLVGLRSNGFEDYYFENRLNPSERVVFSLLKEHTGRDMYLDMQDDGACRFWSRDVNEAFTRRFQECARQHGKAVVVLGDSHAMNIFNALFRAGSREFLVGASQGFCRPHDNYPFCHYDDFERFSRIVSGEVEYVIFHQSGAYFLRDSNGRVYFDEIFDGRQLTFDAENARKTADYLVRIAQHARVVWLGPFVEPRNFNFRHIREIARSGFVMDTNVIKLFERVDRDLAAFLRPRENITYLSLVSMMSVDRESLKVGDCITYSDKDHWSVCGEEIFGTTLVRHLR